MARSEGASARLRGVRPQPRDGENPADEWRAYLDVDEELSVFRPECAEREFDEMDERVLLELDVNFLTPTRCVWATSQVLGSHLQEGREVHMGKRWPNDWEVLGSRPRSCRGHSCRNRARGSNGGECRPGEGRRCLDSECDPRGLDTVWPRQQRAGRRLDDGGQEERRRRSLPAG